ncbi:MAG TPA: SDR family NAD(P)-dependent oxidoreductase [Acidimicrobiales bacterium]|jgi:NAD(P)-dependent dehydrogenase (short-subunit alcohol dehydrogenase family)|nr:SDR family NAD(P)-dependent oxidoreductase [Acidimicrobiales bacterium]
MTAGSTAGSGGAVGFAPDLLAGRRAVVTGAGAGIGLATALCLSAAGAQVVALDIDAAAAAAAAELVGGTAVVADVSKAASLEGAFATAASSMGGLDILVNNAGIGAVTALHRVTDEQWMRLVDVNLKGVFYGIRAAVPLLRAAGGGAIVNVSSLSGLRPTRGEGPYSAAKAGVIALTSSAALEYGPEIRVNCVSPGVIETPLTEPLLGIEAMRERIERRIPLRRVGQAHEVANVVTFLASDLASYLTGTNIVIDGGSVLPSAQTDDLLARFVAAGEQASAQGPAPTPA